MISTLKGIGHNLRDGKYTENNDILAKTLKISRIQLDPGRVKDEWGRVLQKLHSMQQAQRGLKSTKGKKKSKALKCETASNSIIFA